ncbi:MAG TPA: IS630 family transposase [Ktedonobacterales bacterium]
MKPWRHRQWCIPQMSGEFVAAMEDVLALYALPYDARYPTVCLDEKPVVLHAEVRAGLPPAPGHVERRDYEYKRHGTANLFVMVEPLAGWRHVAVTQRRTKRDYAEVLRYLVEERYPEADYICVVQDNLNTHTAGALYETFPPPQARRILAKLEFHHTPKHGSWLNQAEIEISIFERGCLSRPVPDSATLQQRVKALEEERNAQRATIDWQFTNQQARIKLKKLYPVLSERE